MRGRSWSLSVGAVVLLVVAPLVTPNVARASDGGAPAPAPSPTPTHTGTMPPAPSVAATSTTPPKKAPSPTQAKPPPTRPAVRPAGHPDPNVRHQVAGGPTADDAAGGAESPELRALREAERELFAPASAGLSDPWPSELPYPLARVEGAPRAHTSGLPPAPVLSLSTAEGGRDLSWLSQLTMPDLPVRWEPRLVRYLEFYRDDPRGKAIAALYARRSGRYRESIGRVLRRKGLPQDLVWLAMIESAFDPVIRSPAGAIGLWQFMPETGKSYGLPQDRWVDERLDVEAATEAAADFLSDLNRRFGSWELAMASYNMGYGGVLSVVRRYNSNDFWALSRLEGSLPWETTLYVPKILAAAIVMKNPKVFGIDGITPDAPVEFDTVGVPFGVAFSAIAPVAGCTTRELELLNPELRASRTPPKESEAAPTLPGATGERLCRVRVPTGKGALLSANLGKLHHDDAALDKIVLRFGETLDQVAQARGTTVAKLTEINAVGPGEVLRGGALLLVPHAGTPATTSVSQDKTPVVVPSDIFVYPNHKRVFYKVLVGDTLPDIAQALHVSVDDLRRWNELDPASRLHEGMTVQAFVPEGLDLSKVVLLSENDVRVLVVGTEEFFAFWDTKGKRRLVVQAKAGDTLEAVGKRYGVQASLMERINRRGRGDVLQNGDTVVVYVTGNAGAGATTPPAAGATDPEPLGALPSATRPELLPSPNGS